MLGRQPEPRGRLKELTFRQHFVINRHETRRDLFAFLAHYCKQNNLRVKCLYHILGGI